ncbi:hypothetical protein BO71DRAFT_450011 [Aspergillus ellipticus CBS 707.79]|uniref:PRISE-like Rossmann-fold domain-containing protein n=1 Tax=Aspergillus ellipticus CBS 707.79 TaxID=1448320 RepID=A0A319DBD7_9EURO|nr:hypothetical protein BO71DRAFT_450011 [Aspergillus ellipticus CBS 707.79]
MTTPNHALVFGASGINGWAWAFVNELIPTPAFTRITALTNRPLSPSQTLWPASPKLHLVSGIDLLTQIPHLPDVTTVYFCAYIFNADPAVETDCNIAILRNTLVAVEALCPRFRVLVLPTGVKFYGVHLLQDFPFANALPLRETHPPLPAPHHDNLFYTHQLTLLRTLSSHKPWTWIDLRPDIITGFVPHNNQFNLAHWVARYLSLVVPFPGTTRSWNCWSNESSQDAIARFGIWASLSSERTGGESFNVSDEARAGCWRERWGVICAEFGLRGVGPQGDGDEGYGVDVAGWLRENREGWARMERAYGLQADGGSEDGVTLGFVPRFLLSQFDFDRTVSLEKMHAMWGEDKEEREVGAAWGTVLDRFRRARIIPIFVE